MNRPHEKARHSCGLDRQSACQAPDIPFWTDPRTGADRGLSGGVGVQRGREGSGIHAPECWSCVPRAASAQCPNPSRLARKKAVRAHLRIRVSPRPTNPEDR